jgi:hypothetical protein
MPTREGGKKSSGLSPQRIRQIAQQGGHYQIVIARADGEPEQYEGVVGLHNGGSIKVTSRKSTKLATVYTFPFEQVVKMVARSA